MSTQSSRLSSAVLRLSSRNDFFKNEIKITGMYLARWAKGRILGPASSVTALLPLLCSLAAQGGACEDDEECGSDISEREYTAMRARRHADTSRNVTNKGATLNLHVAPAFSLPSLMACQHNFAQPSVSQAWLHSDTGALAGHSIPSA